MDNIKSFERIDKPINTTTNSVGLINCLPQPGLLRHQPPKSMRLNFYPLIKSCGTLTVSSPGTKSIGLRADAQVVIVFASPSGQFYNNVTNLVHLSGPRHLDNFSFTRNFRPSTGTLQKRIPTLTRTATHKTAGPLCLSVSDLRDNFFPDDKRLSITHLI